MPNKEIPFCLDNLFRQYRYIKLKIALCRGLIDRLYYELSGVKGIDYAREKGGYSQDKAIERYYGLSDQITKAEQEARIYEVSKKALDQILEAIKDPDLKQAIIKKHLTEQEAEPEDRGAIQDQTGGGLV